MTRFIIAMLLVSSLATQLQAGWGHHRHRQPAQYMAPMYAAPVYSAPAFSAPMYAAPQYFAPAPMEDRLSAPIQDIMIEMLRDVVRNRLDRIGRQVRDSDGDREDGGSSGRTDSSLHEDVRDLKGQVKDLSLRMENANSILQTHGKKLVENEQALTALSRKFEEGGEIYELFAGGRSNRTSRRSSDDRDDRNYSRDDEEEYRREEYRREDADDDSEMDAPSDQGPYRRER